MRSAPPPTSAVGVPPRDFVLDADVPAAHGPRAVGTLFANIGNVGALAWEATTHVPPSKARLVVLHTWTFESSGPGTFRELMQGLDVGMLGTVRGNGGPRVTDTGHLPLSLVDRVGEEQQVWYRGPAVPYPLTRDAQGPVHAADQARRIAPETGAEDITYAAAFEIGRLLAAADGRLTQDTGRWRRGAYRQAARLDLATQVRASVDVSVELAARLGGAIGLAVAAGAAETLARASVPAADPGELAAVRRAPGLDPTALAAAFDLASAATAAAWLDPGLGKPLAGATVVAPPVRATTAANLDEVAADSAALGALGEARAHLLGRR